MIRKFTAVLAALALALTVLAPTAASARDHRGWDGHRGGGPYGRHYRGHDDDGDELAAGAIGLVLGLALGAAASQPREPRYNNCYRCGPPPGYYQGYRGPPPGYYNQGYQGPPPGYYERGYDDGYGLEGGGYYEGRSQCTRRERQWDRYADRYVFVDVPC